MSPKSDHVVFSCHLFSTDVIAFDLSPDDIRAPDQLQMLSFS
jgi:hypothetical protein